GQPGSRRRASQARQAAPGGAPGLHRADWRAGQLARGRSSPAQGGAMNARTRRRSRMSIRYFDDSILLTETHAYAYYRLPTHAYEFPTPAAGEALAINSTVALAAIRLPEAEVPLRVAHRSFPAAEWAARLDTTSDGGPGWRGYLDEMYQHVWSKDFWAKEVYLGVRLGQRGLPAELAGGGLSPFS